MGVQLCVCIICDFSEGMSVRLVLLDFVMLVCWLVCIHM